jgi:hypothetical protein
MITKFSSYLVIMELDGTLSITLYYLKSRNRGLQHIQIYMYIKNISTMYSVHPHEMHAN